MSYASPGLTWTGNLTPGASATITYSVTVHNPGTGSGILASTVTSATAGSNCAPGSTDPRCTVTVTVAQLAIVNSSNVATTTPDGVVRFTSTFTNSGQVPYTGITIATDASNVLDHAAINGDQTATSGTLTITGASVSWTGSIPAGGTVTVTGTVTVNDSVPLNTVLTSTITTSAAGSNCPAGGTDPRCSVSVPVLTPALTITKTADMTTTTPGTTVGYTITVTDTGQTPYTGATITDDLTGVLGDAGYNGDAAAASTGTVSSTSYTSPDLTWTGNLAVGATVTITYSVTVHNPDTGDKLMSNTVTSGAAGSNCPPGGTAAAACTATVQDLIPALTITKTANIATTTPGGTVDYTITATDTGQTPYTAATITDDLTGILGDAAYNGDAVAATTGTAGSVSYTSPGLTWTGNLAVGGSVTITYSVTVNNPDTGGKVLSNAATSADPGSTCPAGSTGSPCAVTVPVIGGALTITAPASSNLGTASVGSNLSADLGTVQVTDNRGFGAGWTATVSSTSFATGGGTPAETIPVSNASYNITALSQATGPATFTPVPVTQLSTAPQPVVSASNVTGNTTVTWNPIITVTVPPSAIVGPYTATITHSVS